MSRDQMLIAVMAGSLAVSGVDVDACGDKFLRVGRGARFPAYAAVYPASILIYKPANATPEGIRKLQEMLKLGGHRPVVADKDTAVARASTGSVDLVIASYSDAVKLREELRAASARPDILPILHRPTKALAAEAQKQFVHLLLPHAMTNVQALEEIDRLMERRRRSAVTPVAH